jgi:hypothetical protein
VSRGEFAANLRVFAAFCSNAEEGGAMRDNELGPEKRAASGRKERNVQNEAEVTVNVGFNQQQRQLIERLKSEGTFGKTEGEIIRSIFLKWLTDEGSISN